MLNVLFDRSTLRAVGLNRPALPFEVSINDVICDELTKVVEYPEVINTGLYLLPQDPLEDVKIVTNVVETTEETDTPVMTTEVRKVPLGYGYYKTTLGKTTEVTDTPVMNSGYDEEGNALGWVQETDEEGNLLYWGQVPTDEWVDCYTTNEVEVQKTDADGNPLFYKEEEDLEPVLVEQPPLEISIDDERWTPELEPATEVKMATKVVRFDTDMGEFTYDDVLAHKERITTDGSLFRSESYQKSKGVNLFHKSYDLEQKMTEDNTVLDERTKGMQDIDTFTLDKTFQLDDRSEGMKEIDDYTLSIVFELLDRVATLENEIQTLKGGA